MGAMLPLELGEVLEARSEKGSFAAPSLDPWAFGGHETAADESDPAGGAPFEVLVAGDEGQLTAADEPSEASGGWNVPAAAEAGTLAGAQAAPVNTLAGEAFMAISLAAEGAQVTVEVSVRTPDAEEPASDSNESAPDAEEPAPEVVVPADRAASLPPFEMRVGDDGTVACGFPDDSGSNTITEERTITEADGTATGYVQVTTTTSATGSTSWTYRYDTGWNLTDYSYSDSSGWNSITKYQTLMDADGNVTGYTDTTTNTNADGYSSNSSYHYDTGRNLTGFSHSDSSGFNSITKYQTLMDADGNVTGYTDTTTSTNADGSTSTLTNHYGADRNLTESDYADSTGYDSVMRHQTLTDADGNFTGYQQVTTITDVDGNISVWTYQYDAAWNLTWADQVPNVPDCPPVEGPVDEGEPPVLIICPYPSDLVPPTGLPGEGEGGVDVGGDSGTPPDFCWDFPKAPEIGEDHPVALEIGVLQVTLGCSDFPMPLEWCRDYPVAPDVIGCSDFPVPLEWCRDYPVAPDVIAEPLAEASGASGGEWLV